MILKRQIYEASLRQGDEAEKFVESLFDEFNELGRMPPWVLWWERHEKWSHHDINGIDITVHIDCGEIGINVKSSYNFIKRFMRLHGDKGLVVFVVEKGESKEKAFGRLIKYLARRRRLILGEDGVHLIDPTQPARQNR